MILWLVVDCSSAVGRNFVTPLGILYISFLTANQLESFHRHIFRIILQRSKKKKTGTVMIIIKMGEDCLEERVYLITTAKGSVC